jgi:DNA (cytosine-5)-methyltransferase 1
LPDDYDLPDFNVAGKKRAVGNGVPLIIGRVLADAVKSVTDSSHLTNIDVSQSFVQDQSQIDRCPCGCKRVLIGRKKYYDSSCRKRAERLRRNSIRRVTVL